MLAALQLCQVSSQKAEQTNLGSRFGRSRSSGVWQAPGGSHILRSCALVLRVAGEPYKASWPYIKSIIPQSAWLKTSCCLEIMGTNQMVFARSLIFFFLNS